MRNVSGNNSPRIDLQNTTATERKVDGKIVVKAGDKKTRLILNAWDESFNIHARAVKDVPFFLRFCYVNVNFNGQKVALNINSVAKRLNISTNQVKRLVNSNNTMEYLTERASTLSDLSAASHKRVSPSNTIHTPPPPTSKHPPSNSTGLPETPSRQIRKKPPVSKAYKEPTASAPHKRKNPVSTVVKTNELYNKIIQKSGITGISPDDIRGALEEKDKLPNTENSFKYNGRRYFVRKTSTGKDLVYFSQLIGSGSLGKVYKLVNIETGNMIAAKKARKKLLSGERTNIPLEDTKNEVTTLGRINPHGNITGMSKPPEEMDGLIYYTFLYASNLNPTSKSVRRIAAMKKFELCLQLVSSLKHLHDHNYVHADIKPENCLLELDKDGKPVAFVISDFGGAHINDNYTDVSFTHQYLPEDFNNLSTKLENDVYALSKTIIEILLGAYLGSLFEIEIPELSTSVGKVLGPNDQTYKTALKILLQKKGYSEEVANVLISGLSGRKPDGDSKARPTIGELYNSLIAIRTPVKSRSRSRKTAAG